MIKQINEWIRFSSLEKTEREEKGGGKVVHSIGKEEMSIVFTQRVVRDWNRLSRQAVKDASLVLKVGLDGALSKLEGVPVHGSRVGTR